MKRMIALLLCLAMVLMGPYAAHAAQTVYGDANGDGSVNAKDVLVLRRSIAGLECDIDEELADVNGDGEVSMADVLLVRKSLAGLITIGQYHVTESVIADAYINGVSIKDYSIVIPQDADLYTVYAAELLQDYIDDKTGTTLPIFTDEAEEATYEFLIGATNREESASADVSLAADEYILKYDSGKVVMRGDAYMIGGGVGKFTYDYMTYDPSKTMQVCHIDDLPTENVPTAYEALPAKNVIFMIGDGMGPYHAEYSLEYNLRRQLEDDYTEFCADRLPGLCYMTTYSLTTVESGGTTPTDSAASGTALACGYKTINHYVGMDENKHTLFNIRELAASLGKRNAVLTTEPQTGATPAAFTAHVEERSNYPVILTQQNALTNCDYIKGDIEDDLLAETKYTLDLLSTNNEAGFFTMIEEAHIDKAGHGDDHGRQSQVDLVHYMARFNSAIRYAMVFAVAHPDTLLLITADHETGGIKRGLVFTTTKHTTVDVKIYSIGSGSEFFTGTVDNTFVPKVIAAGWGIDNFGDQTLN